MRIDFQKEVSAGLLQDFLRGLPEATKLHGIYSQNGSHVAWFTVPEVAAEDEAAQPKAIKKKGK